MTREFLINNSKWMTHEKNITFVDIFRGYISVWYRKESGIDRQSERW